MKAEDFIVSKRPHLAEITGHQKVDFADYERRLASMQSTVQAIQQAYLGTRERAVMVLEGWDTAGKGGVVRRLGWALDPRSFRVTLLPRRPRTSAASIIFSGFGRNSLSMARSLCSTARGMGGCW